MERDRVGSSERGSVGSLLAPCPHLPPSMSAARASRTTDGQLRTAETRQKSPALPQSSTAVQLSACLLSAVVTTDRAGERWQRRYGRGNTAGHGAGCRREPGVVFIGAVAASNADVAPDRGRWRRGPRAVLSSFPLVGPAARENDGILAVCLVEESIRIERFYSSF